jgi:MFS-type transporter involved in bile tolerance (Atg22 family)
VAARPAPLACFVAAILTASLFYVTAQQVSRSGLFRIVPRWMDSSVFAMLALVFGSAAVECEIVLTRLFSRATNNGGDHENNDTKAGLK